MSSCDEVDLYSDLFTLTPSEPTEKTPQSPGESSRKRKHSQISNQHENQSNVANQNPESEAQTSHSGKKKLDWENQSVQIRFDWISILIVACLFSFWFDQSTGTRSMRTTQLRWPKNTKSCRANANSCNDLVGVRCNKSRSWHVATKFCRTTYRRFLRRHVPKWTVKTLRLQVFANNWIDFCFDDRFKKTRHKNRSHTADNRSSTVVVESFSNFIFFSICLIYWSITVKHWSSVWKKWLLKSRLSVCQVFAFSSRESGKQKKRVKLVSILCFVTGFESLFILNTIELQNEL